MQKSIIPDNLSGDDLQQRGRYDRKKRCQFVREVYFEVPCKIKLVGINVRVTVGQ
jgi:hypothetical protein